MSRRSSNGQASRAPRFGRLFVVVLVPTLLLAALWWWSSGLVQPIPADAAPAAEDTVEVETPPTPRLATPLASMRRMPDEIVGDLVSKRTAEIEGPYRDALRGLVGDGSCVLIVDEAGETVFDLRSDTTVVPASNQKLFVAAGALELLGPEYQLSTEVRGAAPVDGVVSGPLYLVGGGDPLLSTNDAAIANGLAGYEVGTIDALVMQLVATGVTRVEGDVVGVDTRYDDERRSPDWTPAITGYDVPPLGSLVVDDGLDGAGSVPLDPTLTAARTFRAQLEAAGIGVGGSATSSTELAPDALGATTPLATIGSPDVATMVDEMLTTSDNLTAELLLKEIGLSAKGEGSTDAGLGAVRELLVGWGIDVDQVQLSDGSGLSRVNRTTCATMVDLLEVEPLADQIVDDLAVAGVSGTLAESLIGTPAEGRLRAKTGTLLGVKALSGMQPDGSQSDVVFSVILNGPDIQKPSRYEPVWAAVVDLIVHHNTPIDIDRNAFAPIAMVESR